MLTKPLALLREIKTFITIEDNDVGTPKGVGSITIGDVFRGCIYQKQRLLVEQIWTVHHVIRNAHTTKI